MAKIACRWPGGMTLAVLRPGGVPALTFRVDGPPGQPVILTAEEEKRPPSRYAATAIQKTVVDTVKRLQKSAGGDYDPTDYGVTDIPGDFWAAWYAQNRTLDVVMHEMVFEL